jgi:hypothetical protein
MPPLCVYEGIRSPDVVETNIGCFSQAENGKDDNCYYLKRTSSQPAAPKNNKLNDLLVGIKAGVNLNAASKS